MPKYNRYQKGILFLCMFLVLSMIISACSDNTEPTQDQLLDNSPLLVQEISASGEVVPVQWATLSFSNIGEDLKVLVEEGDQVSKGAKLVRNNNPQLEAALLQAQGALERAQFAYEQILDAPSEAALKSAFSAFIAARINLKQQEDNEASDDVIRIAQAEFDAARANYDAVFRGSSEEEIAAAEKDLEAAESALEQAEAAFELTAPFDGTVVEINVKSGENIGAFQPVLVMADLENLQVVTTDLSEVDVTKLEVGQRGEIIFDALSDETFSGRIQKIAKKSNGVSAVYYEVTLSMDEIPEDLRWGMTAFITFPLE
jgi:multidrug efflux pump subunit AcrA (membrane-fusion protein)